MQLSGVKTDPRHHSGCSCLSFSNELFLTIMICIRLQIVLLLPLLFSSLLAFALVDEEEVEGRLDDSKCNLTRAGRR